MQSLGKDLLCYIFSFVKQIDSGGIPLTCKLFNECVHSKRFRGWKAFTEEEIKMELQELRIRQHKLNMREEKLRGLLDKENLKREIDKITNKILITNQILSKEDLFTIDPDLTIQHVASFAVPMLRYIIFTIHGPGAIDKRRGGLILQSVDKVRLQDYLIRRSCRYCKKLNHEIEKCPKLFCDVCNTQGHKPGECNSAETRSRQKRRQFIYGPN